MQQQTAIEWLHEIAKQREPDKFDWEQAKQIEANQLKSIRIETIIKDLVTGIVKDMMKDYMTERINNNTQQIK